MKDKIYVSQEKYEKIKSRRHFINLDNVLWCGGIGVNPPDNAVGMYNGIWVILVEDELELTMREWKEKNGK